MPSLETLHLELGYSHSSFIQGLTETIAKHPGLKLLDLGNTKLNSVDYQALSELLDKNYRINLKFVGPDNPALVQLHAELSQRISTSGLERFKEEQLTQAKLVELVIDTDAARRRWLGRSELNDTLKKLGTELINEIEKCKLELHVKEVAQSEQKGTQKQKDRIKQLEEKNRLLFQTLLILPKEVIVVGSKCYIRFLKQKESSWLISPNSACVDIWMLVFGYLYNS